MSKSSYTEILIEKIQDNAYSNLKEAFVELLAEDLRMRGYGEEIIEKTVDYITTNNDNIDYSMLLDLPEHSEWAKALVDVDIVKTYNFLNTVNDYADDIMELATSCNSIQDALDENGRLTSKGREELVDILNSGLNIFSNLSGNTEVIGTAYSSMIDFLNQEIDSVVSLYMDKANANQLFDLLTDEFGSTSNIGNTPSADAWYEIWSGLCHQNKESWKSTAITPDNPNNATLPWEEVYRLYQKYPEHADVLIPYIEWRYNYEARMALEKMLEDKGLTLEDYLQQLKEEAEILSQEDSDMYYWNLPLDGNSLGKTYLFSQILGTIYSAFAAAKAEKPCTPIYSSSIFFSHILDPLILDLDGDGYNVENKENGTNFDLDKNGFAEKINWTTKDGFLCLDLNGNGNIDNGGEVFGDQTLLADGTTAKNGFEALAQYDSNSDGVIDANDEIFSQLKVWVDADGNGTSGEGTENTCRTRNYRNQPFLRKRKR